MVKNLWRAKFKPQHIHPETPSDIEKKLREAGWQIIAIAEEANGDAEIIGYSDQPIDLQGKSITVEALPETVDWQQQALFHSPVYSEGLIEIDLKHFSKSLKRKSKLSLTPGPAFGDLSHPTTELMLTLLAKYAKGNFVLDIGTGSGILAMAAARFGSKFSWGIDIDEEAVKLACQNVAQNKLQNDVWIGFKEGLFFPRGDLLVLMNMITSEMEQVFKELKEPFLSPGYTIFSGILKEEKEKFIQEQLKKGWKLIEELSKEDWVALVFKRPEKD
jgi:ribosomal protein L11 methyltransferase